MIYDLIIIGSGASGMSAAVYAGRAMLNTLVIEKSGVGGRLRDTSKIVNYPGFKYIGGMELINKFKEHASCHSTNNFIYGTVSKISKDDNIFTVSTKRKGDFKAKAVIVGLGSKPKTLGLIGERAYDGRGVSYCSTCDANFFMGKDIHVLGSGDVALEEAEYLTHFVNKVSIIVMHDEGVVDGNAVQYNKVLENPKIEFIWNSTIDEIKGDGEFINALVLENLRTGERKKISTEGLFMFVGLEPQTDIVKGLVELDEGGFIKVDEKQESSLRGLFATGDCTNTYLRQVITAAADGAKAAYAAEKYIRGRE